MIIAKKTKRRVDICFRPSYRVIATDRYVPRGYVLQTMAYRGFSPLVAIQLACSDDLAASEACAVTFYHREAA